VFDELFFLVMVLLSLSYEHQVVHLGGIIFAFLLFFDNLGLRLAYLLESLEFDENVLLMGSLEQINKNSPFEALSRLVLFFIKQNQHVAHVVLRCFFFVQKVVVSRRIHVGR
jgi:hypothetical protein